jgi:hypothetical protein
MKNITAVIILIFVHACIYAQSADSNKKTAKQNTNPLAGTWRLIEFSDLDSLTGKWIYRYGKKPRGYFTYTKTNIVNLNISTDTPLKISEDSAKKLNVNLLEYLNTVSLGYFGTYTLDLEKSIVTHHVKGGCLPWYIDTDQPRPFTLKGDTLTIGNSKTWKRVLVRAD